MGPENSMEKEMELNEREAVVLKREQMLEQRIREILRREQMVAVKEERIEDLLRQLQSLGLHDVAAGLEDTFEAAIADLERTRVSRRKIIEDAESMSDGGINGTGLWGKSVEMRAAQDEQLMLDLLDEPGLEPEEKARRFLERLDRELDSRNRNEVWDRADRMRYLAATFQDAGNHSKSAEYSRRALVILGEFT
ncbi:MAG: hypothetical protein LN414_02770 [Candidatus Thermoplasmatota archaeon]|nr:hypothetical protein [Candidatus Thermoplasmatota archaeon]